MMKVKQHRAGAENLRIFFGHSGTLLELSYSSCMFSSLKVSSCVVSLLAAGKEISGVCKRSRNLRGDLRRVGAERYLAPRQPMETERALWCSLESIACETLAHTLELHCAFVLLQQACDGRNSASDAEKLDVTARKFICVTLYSRAGCFFLPNIMSHIRFFLVLLLFFYL